MLQIVGYRPPFQTRIRRLLTRSGALSLLILYMTVVVIVMAWIAASLGG